ncbi:YggT family protein [Paucidesulfovibrio gracilis DSM 16080]|uniref:YggT family protein n=1 Tax=Paucidesulfovibrio gracilis DSM 16080 TaxID=1121449 RepID=A0A1T4WTJ3_9BACT|nr:YggT family protein [Paucidesulfovibrio gracilis]SKA80427.1 YggT family protein [Paucidesulfovibrio gracilis DSM 16080]
MDLVIRGLAQLIHVVLFGYQLVVIVAALITWVNPDPYNPIVRTLRALTEPVFYRVRRWLPFVYVSGIDLSPVVVILVLGFLDYVIPGNLIRLAMHV